MANKKISELTATTSLTGAEIIPIVQTGVSKSITVDVLMASPTYIYFVGGNIRIGERGGNFVIDKVIGGTGFAGTEDIDWENIGGAGV